jgi:hypothetical protein
MERGQRFRYVLRVKDEEQRDMWVKTLQEESSKFLPLHDFFNKLRYTLYTSCPGSEYFQLISIDCSIAGTPKKSARDL